MIILLHSSKTMRSGSSDSYQEPTLINQAKQLTDFIVTLTPAQIAKAMHISPKLAKSTLELMATWSTDPKYQIPAIDAFLGDIYSGLQVQSFTKDDRSYANDHLVILSGLYGVLRALDSIHPYRLEMGYRFPNNAYKNMYSYWDDQIAAVIPHNQPILNLSAVEYTKAVLPYLIHPRVISPKFMTLDPVSGEPKFVVVHAKIARGAFARWVIQNKIDDTSELVNFTDLNYLYDKKLSTDTEPVFVCKEFDGLGLSVRLTK